MKSFTQSYDFLIGGGGLQHVIGGIAMYHVHRNHGIAFTYRDRM